MDPRGVDESCLTSALFGSIDAMEGPDMRRPPFDPHLEAALSAYVGSPINGITAEMIAQKRADEEAAPSHRDSAVAAGVTIRDVTAAG